MEARRPPSLAVSLEVARASAARSGGLSAVAATAAMALETASSEWAAAHAVCSGGMALAQYVRMAEATRVRRLELELEGVGDVLAVLHLEDVLERLQTVGDEEEEALRTRLVVPEGDAGDGDGTQGGGGGGVRGGAREASGGEGEVAARRRERCLGDVGVEAARLLGNVPMSRLTQPSS